MGSEMCIRDSTSTAAVLTAHSALEDLSYTEAQHEQTVFDREAELERQLAAAQAKLARKREQQNDSQSRWRERQGDEGRRKHAEYMRDYRAQKRP